MKDCKQCGMDVPGMEWPGQKCAGCHQYPLERVRYSTPGWINSESNKDYHARAINYVAERQLMDMRCGTCGAEVIGHSDDHPVIPDDSVDIWCEVCGARTCLCQCGAH